MFKKRCFLIILGLILGALLGCGVLALQDFLGGLIISSLNDEVKASLPNCYLTSDDHHVSLFRKNAYTNNPRIICDGNRNVLFFKQIRATFGFRDIFHKVLWLDNLILDTGHSEGFSPKSETYKFIDYLITPIPGSNPPIRFSTKELLVLRSSITEEVADGVYIKSNDANLHLSVDDEGNTFLTPFIKKVYLYKKDKNETKGSVYEIGNLSLNLVSPNNDKNIYIQNAGISKSGFNLKANIDIDEKNNFQNGNWKTSIDNNIIKNFVKENINFAIQGNGDINGGISNSSVTGDIKLNEEKNNNFLNSFFSTFEAFSNDKESAVKLGKISFSGNNFSGASTKDFKISSNNIEGNLKFKIDNLEYDGFKFENINGNFSIFQDEQKKLNVQISLDIQNITSDIFKNIPLNATILLRDDIVDISLSSNQNIIGNAKINLNKDGTKFLESSNIKINNLILNKKFNERNLNLSGDVFAKGALFSNSLEAKSNIKLSIENLDDQASLHGIFELKNGLLSGDIQNPSKSIKSQISFDLKNADKNFITLSLNKFAPRIYNPEMKCSDLSLNSRYDFSLESPLTGNGNILIQDLNLGCKPHRLSLKAKEDISIQNGILSINSLNLVDDVHKNSFFIAGDIDFIDTIDVHVKGDFNLNSLQDFANFTDSISGKINADLAIYGDTYNPNIDGNAEIENASVFLDNISIYNLNGKLELNNHLVDIKNATCNVNNGKANLSGKINLEDIKQSQANINFEKIDFTINENTSFNVQGDIAVVNTPENKPKIQGEINIANFDFVQSLTIESVIKFITNKIFIFKSKNIEKSENEEEEKNPIDLLLDIKLKSENISIQTDWCDIILGSDLHITGNAMQPDINGNIEGLDGWFGLKNKKFLLNTAKLVFKDKQPPFIEIVGEAYLRNFYGDNSLVIVNIVGPIDNPNVILTSDSGLSQKEIFNLLMSGEASSSVDTSGSNRSLLIPALKTFLKYPTRENLKYVYNAITSLGNISVTPKYNLQTGTTEPAITAEKKLSEDISAIGESFVSGSSSNAKMSLIYNMSDEVFLNAYTDTSSAASQSGAGLDINYVILKSKNSLVSYYFKGNNDLNDWTLKKATHINEAKQIDDKKIEDLKKRLFDTYKSYGYINAKIKAKTKKENGKIKKVFFFIKEGNKFKISKIKFKSKILKNELEDATSKYVNASLTMENVDNLDLDIRNILKENNYLSAKIMMSEEKNENATSNIIVEINEGKKFIIKFQGNKAFERYELLQTINYEKRIHPFSTNTIKALKDAIKKLYNDHGYLFATTSLKIRKRHNVIKYTIYINEGKIYKLDGFSFEGNQKFSDKKLENLIQEDVRLKKFKFFDSKYIVVDDIQSNLALIKKIYEENGYPDAEITYDINILKDNDHGNVIYKIKENQPKLISKMIVLGIPEELKDSIKREYNNLPLAKKEKLVREISMKVSREGYLNNEIFETQNENGEYEIKIETGEKVTIRDIQIVGNSKIDDFTILSKIKLKKDSILSGKKFIQSKNALLKLGFFNNIKLSLKEAKEDKNQKDLVIEVEEKPLDSLSVGIGAHSEYGVHFLTSGINKSIFKDGKTISLSTDIFYDASESEVSQGSTDLKFLEPALFNTNVSFVKDFRYQKLTTSTYEFDLDRFTSAVSLLFPVDEKISFNIGHNITSEELADVSKGAIIGKYDTGDYILSYLSANLKYDTRDNMLNPRSGYAFDFEYDITNNLLGSDAEFYTAKLRSNAILPFFDDFNFSFNNLTGVSETLGNTDEIPIAHRFYLGGNNSIRGFKENSLGPKGYDGSVIGGDFIFSNNFELNYFVIETFSVHTFLDVGNVFLKDEDIDLDDLRKSFGIGFKFNLPIGPIGFDLAFPIDKEDDEDSYRLHFAIGSKF